MIKMVSYFHGKRLRVLVIGLLCLFLLGSILLTSGLTSNNDPSSATLSDMAADIYKHRTLYVGDNSKVVNLLSQLPFAEFRREVSLKTNEQPYGITVKYEITDLGNSNMDDVFYNNAVILFTLIDNVDQLTFEVSGLQSQTYNFTRSSIQNKYLEDLRTHAQSLEQFQDFLFDLLFTVYAAPEAYTLVLSYTPGIQFLADYIEKDVTVRYNATNGIWLTWDASGNITRKGPSVQMSPGKQVYWTPLADNGEVSEEETTQVTITILDSKDNMLAEKQVYIAYDGDEYYFVMPSRGVRLNAELDN
ncbi:DUF4825 domain-containing protein [Candidatus Contubernalis alkaliaceticus]|uniref:DUF4825 domain-containing protein n=1 Tax=Candidatus Contubernalis alkaliaceticus TaxID=338645 RepID=UPI001F4BD920|nr:DUF4825 domain-containing protein [Candidatus Contubernalis alkalaceticus]UNC91343.1 DUF4825 domain-containing protein [Candidatus Contubernalis alkalaceticus]